MKSILFCWLALAYTCAAATDNQVTAAHLARMARKAQESGQVVHAYMLFAEAAARDPGNPTYRSNRDALAPAAHLLTQAQVETVNIDKEIQTAENEPAHPEPPIQRIQAADWENSLQPIPKVKTDAGVRDFNLHGEAKTLLAQVSEAYGLKALVDSELESGKPIHFEMPGADLRSALEGLTAATHTFVFPISPNTIYFAPDTEAKRNQLEPVVVLTFTLPEALTEKDLIEAANAVRTLLRLRAIGWDSFSRTVVIRDRQTRANIGRSLLEALLLPHGQVSFDVQFLTVDTDRKLHYGVTLQTLFQFIDFGKIGGFKSVLPAAIGPSQFLTFGGGATLFGVAVADSAAFASYSNSFAQVLYDATVVVDDRQTADFHVGDKYPIASSLYTGFSQGTASIYNPAPQITLEDLGLVLKIRPHINGNGDVDMELEAEFRTLGSQTYNTVPSIAERAFKGNVSLRQGEWAIVAGLESLTNSVTRTGMAGVGQIPGLRDILTDTTREKQTSNTLVVIKPTVTRLPMSDVISPQFLLGPVRGERVLL